MVNWANVLTLSRVLGIPLFVGALYLPSESRNIIAAFIFALLAMTDWVDGWLARKYNQKSHFGAVLDPVADKLLVAVGLIFLIDKGIDKWMAYVMLAREFIVTGARVLVKEMVMPSFLGKAKTAVQMVAILAVLLSVPYSWWIVLIATILTVVSGFEYLWLARKSFVKLW